MFYICDPNPKSDINVNNTTLLYSTHI